MVGTKITAENDTVNNTGTEERNYTTRRAHSEREGTSEGERTRVKSDTVLELFCGVGGFSMGFEEHGFEVIAGVDIDENALATYAANHDAPAKNIDLAETTPDELLNELGVDADDIDVIAGGPPCQAFSQAGNRDPDDDRAALTENYFDIIERVQPKVFVMENVKGLLTIDDGRVIERVEERIDEMGYRHNYEVLNAADYGVPQARERLILLGNKVSLPRLPAPTCEEWVPVSHVLDDDGCDEWGRPYLITSPSGAGKQVKGESPFRTTDEPAYTLTKNYPRLIPPDFEPHEDATAAAVQYRRLTKEECARIQSFPDDFEWKGKDEKGQKGNAVPPRLASAIASRVSTALFNLHVDQKKRAHPEYFPRYDGSHPPRSPYHVPEQTQASGVASNWGV